MISLSRATLGAIRTLRERQQAAGFGKQRDSFFYASNNWYKYLRRLDEVSLQMRDLLAQEGVSEHSLDLIRTSYLDIYTFIQRNKQ